MRCIYLGAAATLVFGPIAHAAVAGEARETIGAPATEAGIVPLPESAEIASGDKTDLDDLQGEPGESTVILLPRDTPVHLMVTQEVTTKTHSVGHRFKLRVNEAVEVDGVAIIPVGAIAWGQVTSAKGSGNLGKSGRLEAELLYVEVGDRRIAIDGQASDKGNSGTAETVMGVIGLGIFGLFAKGNNAKIKAGQKMTAFTVEDVEFKPEIAS